VATVIGFLKDLLVGWFRDERRIALTTRTARGYVTKVPDRAAHIRRLQRRLGVTETRTRVTVNPLPVVDGPLVSPLADPPQRGMAPGTAKLPPPTVGPAKVPQPPAPPYGAPWVEWGTFTGQTVYMRPDPRAVAAANERATAGLRKALERHREQTGYSPGGITPASPLAGVTAEEAGANMAAAASAVFGPCSHPRPVPVELRLTGEIVAALCPDCDRQLPASWGLAPREAFGTVPPE